MNSYIGFRFEGVPADDIHRYYRALKDYGLAAYEVDNLVFAECKGSDGMGMDDEKIGDIVPIIELLDYTLPYLKTAIGQKVVLQGIRLDEGQIEEIERHAATREGQVNFNEVFQKIRCEEGETGVLRDGQQPSQIRQSGGGTGEGNA